jgi:hypothetical protein
MYNSSISESKIHYRIVWQTYQLHIHAGNIVGIVYFTLRIDRVLVSLISFFSSIKNHQVSSGRAWQLDVLMGTLYPLTHGKFLYYG